jgi:hypothetical protein
MLNEILNGKRPVTTEYALLFLAALGIFAVSLFPPAPVFLRRDGEFAPECRREVRLVTLGQ